MGGDERYPGIEQLQSSGMARRFCSVSSFESDIRYIGKTEKPLAAKRARIKLPSMQIND
jgi:hypothetical protein